MLLARSPPRAARGRTATRRATTWRPSFLYPAFADRPSQAVELELLGRLQEAERRGYPVKVALVARAGDLTDEPSMLRRPQRYAEFVSSELGAGVRGPIVVVTPFGFGASGAGVRPSVASGPVQPRGGGDALAVAAMAAPASMLGTSASADSGPSDLVRIAALFGVTFLVLFGALELWSRRGRRPGASRVPRTPRRTARASAAPPPARRS